MSTGPGGRCEACAPPRVGPFLLRHQLIALSAIRVVGVGGDPFPRCVPQILQLCLPGTGQGAPSFWVGAHGTFACTTGSRVRGPGAPNLPWQGTLRVLVSQGEDKVAFCLPAGRRVPHSPVCPCPACPPHMPLRGGWRQAVRGVGILAGASLNLASVECHLTQTVCASLSPYQPFCSSHLRGGAGSGFGRRGSHRSPRALQPPFPSLLPPGCQTLG